MALVFLPDGKNGLDGGENRASSGRIGECPPFPASSAGTPPPRSHKSEEAPSLVKSGDGGAEGNPAALVG